MVVTLCVCLVSRVGGVGGMQNHSESPHYNSVIFIVISNIINL
jgi:hypothetical protein